MDKNLALETLKSFVENTDNVIAKDAILALHPELAESEDERIRKILIAEFSLISEMWFKNVFSGKLSKNEFLAWLEKQEAKEKYDRVAPIYEDEDSFESALDKAWKFYNDSGSSTVDGCEDNFIELAFAKGFREGFLYKKQKEPRPIPDKFSGIKSLMLQYLQAAANRKDDSEIEADTDLWGRKILDYVWSFEQKEQKNVGTQDLPHWKPSEEQMDRLVSIVAALRKDYCDDMADFLASLYNDLKKL